MFTQERKGYVRLDNSYYEGDKLLASDKEVPLRPSQFHVWDANNGWTIDAVAKQSADNAVAAEEQEKEDIAALRSMRKVLSAVALPLGTAPDIVTAQQALKE